MMNSTPMLSRLMAYGLLMFSLLVGWTLIITPLTAGTMDKLSLFENLSHQVARYEALQDQKADTEAMVRSLKGGSLDSWTFKGQAAAELQRVVRQAASKQGLTINNSRAVGVAEMGSFNRVGISLTVQGKHEQIYEFLAAIRASKPIMIVDGLMLRSQGARAGAPVMLSLQRKSVV